MQSFIISLLVRILGLSNPVAAIAAQVLIIFGKEEFAVLVPVVKALVLEAEDPNRRPVMTGWEKFNFVLDSVVKQFPHTQLRVISLTIETVVSTLLP